MEVLEAFYNEIINFFGIANAWEILKSGDYGSFKTYEGIVALIVPIMPLLLVLYHFVCPIKYRRKVLGDSVSETFKKICLQIEERYEIHFLEIGLDGDHVHFLIQSVPENAPKKIISAVKSITAREIFRLHPEVKQMLWGAKFWTSGYYMNTVGRYANEEVIKKYLQNQGRTGYEKLHRNQLKLF